MDPLDKLLAEVKADYTQERPRPASEAIPELQPLQPPAQPNPNETRSPHSLNPAASAPDPALANLLDDIKADYTAQDQQAAQQHQQQLEAERQRQEQRRIQQQQALRQQAETWLAELDQTSPEGLWFEEFAGSYASRVQAAIDYLTALQQGRSQPS